MRTGFLSRGMALLTIVLLAACASPHMSAEMEAGKMAFQTGDYPKAFHDLLPVAKAGRPEAQYAVGYMYYYGYGVPRDLSAGLFWIGRAAAQHYPAADQALERIRQENTMHEEADVTARLYKKPAKSEKMALPPVEKPKKITKKPVTKPTQPVQPPHSSKHVSLVKASHTIAEGVSKQHKQKSVQPVQPPAGHVACTAEAARYVLQLYGSWQFNTVVSVRKQLGLNGKASVCVTKRDAKNWYVLVVGEYANRAAAEKAKAALLPHLNGAHPWVRGTTGLFAAEI